MPGVSSLGEHVVVPAGQSVGDACFVKEFHLAGIRYDVIFARTGLELGSKKRFVSLHGRVDVNDDAIVMHVAVGDEFRDVVEAEKKLALTRHKLLIHSDVDGEFVAAAVNPTWEIMTEGNGDASASDHASEHFQIVGIIRPP